MNLTDKKIARKAAEYAKNLLERAHENEPQITKDLQKIAEEVSAKIIGLEHKFKSEESLAHKLAKNSRIYLSYISDKQTTESSIIEKSVARTAEKNNDVLRYTFILSLEKYTFCFRRTLNELANLEYRTFSKNIWNAWKNVGTNFDKGYRGINITVISSQWQKFELQFHTAESFRLKMETHNLYKEAGLEIVSKERKEEISKIMVKAAKNISIPKGVTKL